MSLDTTLLSRTSAPGKVILAGEHAVVYGRPAIAVPVWQVVATCTIEVAPPGSGFTLALPDVGAAVTLAGSGAPDAGDAPGAPDARGAPAADASAVQPLAHVARAALAQAGRTDLPDWQLTLSSTIPIAGGLGSGAALSTALVRAIFAAAGQPVTPAQVSALVYQSEVAYHGTPSGIDNTVIAHGRPLWFVRGRPPSFITIGGPLTLLIADSGIRSPTLETVADVRAARERRPAAYDAIFAAIGAVAHSLRAALEAGNATEVGRLLNTNHALLADLGVSSPTLEQMVRAARTAGALGAKLSGGGRGGNVIALVAPTSAAAVERALAAAGALRVLRTPLRDEDQELFSSQT